MYHSHTISSHLIPPPSIHPANQPIRLRSKTRISQEVKKRERRRRRRKEEEKKKRGHKIARCLLFLTGAVLVTCTVYSGSSE